MSPPSSLHSPPSKGTVGTDMFLGIDLGTSEVKLLLMDERGHIVGTAGAPLPLSRLQPLWSEQDPADWWHATEAAVAALRSTHGAAFAEVRAVGLSGQMHGAVLLGADDAVLRPAILWNGGRSHAECEELTRAAPSLHAVAGNLAMPGFTAPKLLWVRRHEPRVFAATRSVLLPKDYLRRLLTGEKVTDPSDAAGTLHGLRHETTRGACGYAVLEGVAFGLADGLHALRSTGTQVQRLSLVGGGSRSPLWAQLIADALGVEIVVHSGAEAGAALGAARLARMACGNAGLDSCTRPDVAASHRPDPQRHEALQERLLYFRQIYRQIKTISRRVASGPDDKGRALWQSAMDPVLNSLLDRP